ncbi:MAG: hypothetical protein HY332_02020 [Chloroflexi bacterium]|nr:hypothetical protein [Chloroflexota bacterium]
MDVTDLGEDFVRLCRQIFDFLIHEYRFRVEGVTRDEHTVAVIYKNATTGVEISYEPRQNDIFVYLIRLVEGDIPAYLDRPLNWLYLHNLLEYKGSQRDIVHKSVGDWLTAADIETILRQYADALRACADDVLRGDFRAFDAAVHAIRGVDDHEMKPGGAAVFADGRPAKKRPRRNRNRIDAMSDRDIA